MLVSKQVSNTFLSPLLQPIRNNSNAENFKLLFEEQLINPLLKDYLIQKNVIAYNLFTLKCRWFCFSIRTDLEKFSIKSLTHQWILCSEWVPSEWESKQLIKASQ